MFTPAEQVVVLLVSQPGIMHNTLCSILRSLPNALVAETSGALSAYDYLESGPADAVIIDANIPLAERLALLTRVKAQFPDTHCLVLTMTARNHRLLGCAGADRVLLQNCSTADIEAAVFAGQANGTA
jgi:DNA-binding NarL/FixJ family response regulator